MIRTSIPGNPAASSGTFASRVRHGVLSAAIACVLPASAFAADGPPSAIAADAPPAAPVPASLAIGSDNASPAFHPPSLAGALFSKRSAAILLVGGAIAAASVQGEDADYAARSLQNSPVESLYDFGNVYGTGAVSSSLALGLLTAGWSSGRPELTAAGQDLVRGLVVSGLIVGGTKMLVDRTRPDGDRYSFPSGHSANAFAVATILDSHFGHRVGIPAYALAGATAIGRMEARRHYLSDVVFGASVGLAVGFAVTESSPSRYRPELEVRGNGAALTVRF
jgi:membrane-associated phospholipid phosphatase